MHHTIHVILSASQRSRRTCVHLLATHRTEGHPERSIASRCAVEGPARFPASARPPQSPLAQICLLLLALILTFQAQAQQTLPGTWQGTLQAEKSLRLVLKIEPAPTYKATFYSIDQPSPSFPGKTTVDGTAVTIAVPTIDGTFTGKLSPDSTSIVGTWAQGGGPPLPLTLIRATPATAWVIPPPPAPPKMMAADSNPAFEVATIKPNDTGAHGMQQLTFNGHQFIVKAGSLVDLISFAYGVQAKQITAAPDWATSQRYDIEAVPDTPGMPTVPQINTMIQKLLTERFQLKFHKEQREMSAFVITQIQSQTKGPQKPQPTQVPGPGPGFGAHPSPGGLTITARNGTLAEFAGFLQNIVLDRPVVDQTGLTARFDLDITFTPDDSQFNGHPPPLPTATDNTPTAPNLTEAMQKDAGLRMEAKKTPVNVIVIDHAERYSAN